MEEPLHIDTHEDNESANCKLGVAMFAACGAPHPHPPKWLRDRGNFVLFETIAILLVSWWRVELPASSWALDPTDQWKRYRIIMNSVGGYIKNSDQGCHGRFKPPLLRRS